MDRMFQPRPRICSGVISVTHKLSQVRGVEVDQLPEEPDLKTAATKAEAATTVKTAEGTSR
jgi:hypothetical protein